MAFVKILRVNAPHKVINGVPFKIFFKLRYISWKPFKIFVYIIQKKGGDDIILAEYERYINKDWFIGTIDCKEHVTLDTEQKKVKISLIAGYVDRKQRRHQKHCVEIER